MSQSGREHSAETSLAADAVKLKVQGPRTKLTSIKVGEGKKKGTLGTIMNVFC